MTTQPLPYLNHVVIFGSGQWAKALGHLLKHRAKRITFIVRENANALHDEWFSHHPFSLTTDMSVAQTASLIISALPAQVFGQKVSDIKHALGTNAAPLIQTAKGIDLSAHALLIDIHKHHLTNTPAAILSGPGFAADVLNNQPIAVTIAADTAALAQQLCEAMATPSFRPYASDDMIGVSLGGALKNIYAIAAGIAAGLELGDSARASLITRAFAEMSRITLHLGGINQTLHGLSGLGDLILTASSDKSRNYSYGVAISQGNSGVSQTVEGIKTALALADMLKTSDINTPLLDALVSVLRAPDVPTQSELRKLISTLMQRPIKHEGLTL